MCSIMTELEIHLLSSNPSSQVIILALVFEMDHAAAPDLLTFEIHVTVLESNFSRGA